jgi:hypothetical protein
MKMIFRKNFLNSFAQTKVLKKNVKPINFNFKFSMKSPQFCGNFQKFPYSDQHNPATNIQPESQKNVESTFQSDISDEETTVEESKVDEQEQEDSEEITADDARHKYLSENRFVYESGAKHNISDTSMQEENIIIVTANC